MGHEWGIMLLLIKPLYNSNSNVFSRFCSSGISHLFFMAQWGIHQARLHPNMNFIYLRQLIDNTHAAQPNTGHPPAPKAYYLY
jgi:hypothetical protein